MWSTTFPNRAARTKIEHNGPWESVVAMVGDPPVFPDKESCPWISLARYGDTPSAKGSLKHAANVICISGVEGDYDGGRIPIEEAAARARFAGLRAVFYTSPSHTPAAPRWRVLCALGREYPLEARSVFVDRLNGILGGVLTAESWYRAQGFTYGRVVGREYQCLTI